MEPSRRLFFVSLGAADFVAYDQREVFSLPSSVRQMESTTSSFRCYHRRPKLGA